jgi:ABC-2 type transport system permease protein
MTRSSFAALLVGILLEGGLSAWYLSDSTAFESLFPDILEQFSLYQRFYTFVNGVFDLTGLVYFITVIALFLFLTVQSMEKRRWSE